MDRRGRTTGGKSNIMRRVWITCVAILSLAVPRTTTAFVLAGGNSHTCFIRPDSNINCFGNTEDNSARINAPVLNPGVRYMHLVAGYDYSLAVLSNGSVVAWGVPSSEPNYDDLNPMPNLLPSVIEPPRILTRATNANPVERCMAGFWFACCYMRHPELLVDVPLEDWNTTTNALYNIPLTTNLPICFGSNQKHALTFDFPGYQMIWQDHSKFDPSKLIYEVVQVDAHFVHTCFLMLPVTNQTSPRVYSYTIYCIGDKVERPRFNQLTESAMQFTRFDESGLLTQPVVQMSSSNRILCLLLQDSSVECFGQSNYAEDLVPGYAKELRCLSLTSGTVHFCCLQTSLQVRCWGDQLEGAATPPPGTFSTIVASSYHTIGIRTTGTIAIWGAQDHLQSTYPTLSVSLNVTHPIALGEAHTCIVRSSTVELVPLPPVACFGNNDAFQCEVPVTLTGRTIVFLAAGGKTTCALVHSDSEPLPNPGDPVRGTPVCWGRNNQGQASPPPGLVLRYIGMGQAHACGLMADTGYPVCWGGSEVGQTAVPPQYRTVSMTSISGSVFESWGVSTTGQPIHWGQVTGTVLPEGPDVLYADAQAAGYNMCGLLLNGTLYCRGGDNAFGEQVVPTDVLTWKSLAAGFYFTCGVVLTPVPPPDVSSIRCWGDLAGRSAPPIIAASGISTIVSGGTNACIITVLGQVQCWGRNNFGELDTPGTFVRAAPPHFYHTWNETFLPCPGGTYSVGYGASDARCSGYCLGGYFGRGSSSSALCEEAALPGTYSPIGSTAPLPCPPNQYAPQAAAAACTTCYETVSGNATVCGPLVCNVGEEVVAVALELQQLVGANKICVACVPGRYSSRVGVPCIDCGLDSYSPLAGATTCFSCSLQEGLTCTHGHARVKTDYFGIQDSVTGEIRTWKCPEELCDGEMTNETISSPTDVERVQSIIDGTNKITLRPLVSPCGQNRWNNPSNLLCGECSPGYRPWAGSCLGCETFDYIRLIILVAITFVLVLLLHRSSQNVTGTVAISSYFLQVSLLQIRPIYSILEWASFLNFDIDGNSENFCLFPISTYLQDFAISATIPVVFGGELFLVMIFHWLAFKLFCSRNTVAQTQVIPAENDPAGRRASVVRQVVKKAKFPWSSYSRTFLALLLISYQQVSVVTIKYLNCRSIEGVRVISAWPSVSCDSPEYKNWLGLLIGLLCVDFCGLPIAIVSFFYYHRAKLFARDVKFISYFGTLTIPYKESCYMWSAAVLVRRVVVIALSIAFAFDQDYRFLSFSNANLFFFCLSVYVQPYRRKTDNRLEVVSLGAMCLITILLQSASNPYPEEYQIAISAMILFMLFLFVAIIGTNMKKQWEESKRAAQTPSPAVIKEAVLELQAKPATPKANGGLLQTPRNGRVVVPANGLHDGGDDRMSFPEEPLSPSPDDLVFPLDPDHNSIGSAIASFYSRQNTRRKIHQREEGGGEEESFAEMTAAGPEEVRVVVGGGGGGGEDVITPRRPSTEAAAPTARRRFPVQQPVEHAPRQLQAAASIEEEDHHDHALASPSNVHDAHQKQQLESQLGNLADSPYLDAGELQDIVEEDSRMDGLLEFAVPEEPTMPHPSTNNHEAEVTISQHRYL